MKRYIRSSELSYERREGLGLNHPSLKLSNGDEVVLNMSAHDRGFNQLDLPLDDNIEDHFQETFVLEGVGKKCYNVTRECIVYHPGTSIRGGRFKSKIVKVEEV